MEDPSGTFTFQVQGTGMGSLFKTGDSVKVRRLPPEQLRPGDIIVFVASWGGAERPKRLAIHRLLVKKRGKDGRWRLWAKPETRMRLDTPITEDCVLGRVVAVSRAGGTWQQLETAD